MRKVPQLSTETVTDSNSDKKASQVHSISPQLALFYAVAVNVMWGVFPLYFNHLAPANPLEVIVHRAVWAFLFCLLLLAATKQLGSLKVALKNSYARRRLTLAGFLIVINWSTYIYAVQNDRTIDAALGYFISPLVTVALAYILLRERTRMLQNIALFFGVVAVLVFIIGLGYLPWVSIVCPLSFGFYTLSKKNVASQIPPLVGMVMETAVVIPFLLVYYAYLLWHRHTSFQVLATEGYGWPGQLAHLLLLIGAGVLTAIPLILLARATQGLSLGVIGLVQYLSPVLQLLVGVLIFHEAVEPIRWLGTAVVWVALLFLIIDGFAENRKIRKLEKHGLKLSSQ